MLKIVGDQIELLIDMKHGSRIKSLLFAEMEFAVPFRPNPMDWGWYGMVPWAGRIRDGLIKDNSGKAYQLPTDLDPPHAEHGFGFVSEWTQTDENSTELHLPFPFVGAIASQSFHVIKNTLVWNLEYEPNGCELPAWVGFHPWFPMHLSRGGPARLDFQAQTMLVKGQDIIPTGEYSAPSAPPWNDTFTGLAGAPTVTWQGAAGIRIEADVPWWVVYSEDSEGICVEPQTAPPDANNLGIAGSHRLEAKFIFEHA